MIVSIESILVVVLVLMPGFVSTAALRKSVANIEVSTMHFVVMTVATGTIVHFVAYF